MSKKKPWFEDALIKDLKAKTIEMTDGFSSHAFDLIISEKWSRDNPDYLEGKIAAYF